MLTMSVTVLLALSSVSAAEPASQRPPAQNEVPSDPYVAVPPEARVTSPARLWVHGGFVSVQVNVDASGQNIVGDAANEPSLVVLPFDHRRMAIGWRQFDTVTSDFRQAGRGFSSDGGQSWTFPGVLAAGTFRSDPVLEAGPDGTVYYESLDIAPNYNCLVYASTDGGASFGAQVSAYGGDKSWMAADRTAGPGRGKLYQAWDYAGCCGSDWFDRSTDGGASFEYPVPIPSQPYWGTVEVTPDGTVLVAGITDLGGFAVARSSTAQLPSAPPAFDGATAVDLGGSLVYFLGSGPNPGGLMGQVWVDSDHSDGPTRGNVYVLASVDPPTVDPLDVHIVRSTDGGLTFGPPVRVNDDLANTSAWQWFGTLSVAPNGRLDVIWNDTRNHPGTYLSELYYAFSTDAGQSWSANQQLSPPFDPLLGWPQQNKLGDYYDMTSDKVGADVAYAATFNGEQDVYSLRIGERDWNDNGIGDTTEGLIFADGFELGTCWAWADTVP